LQRDLTPRAHNTAVAFAALFLAVAGGGGAAYICTGAGRHVGPGASPEACSDSCHAPASSHSLPGSLRWDISGADLVPGERPFMDDARVENALHGRDSADVAARADLLALAFLKKKIKKSIKAHRKTADLPAAPVTRIPVIDVDSQNVSPQTHPAIPLLRTVRLLV